MTLDSDIAAAVDCLRHSGVILYPTDTVWGLGCDATDPKAIHKIYELKRRAEAKALITLVSDIRMLERYVDDIPEVALQLVEAAVNPITVVYDSPVNLAPQLLAADGSAALRITSETYSRRLCRELRRPVVSTSANISGMPAPAFFNQISPEIINAVDYVASFRRDDTTPRTPSTVIKISNDSTFKILRK